MANIGIITCSNCTQDLDCASMICLKDLRERKCFSNSTRLKEKYARVIREAYPDVNLVMGTHMSGEPREYQTEYCYVLTVHIS